MRWFIMWTWLAKFCVMESTGFAPRARQDCRCSPSIAWRIDRQYRRDRAAIDINNIGAVLFRAGQFEAAIKCYEQSLVIRREVRDRAGEGRVLDNLGTAHYRLGDFEKALAYYRQALVIRREVGDAKGEVTTLVKIGNVYGQFGQLEEAIGSYEQALTVARTAKLLLQRSAAS
jgi:tetratricopeptide (TPR) repeat protein